MCIKEAIIYSNTVSIHNEKFGTIEYQKNFTEVAVLFREGVRNFFMVGQSEADITKFFEYLQKYKFLPFLKQIFGGAIAHPGPSALPGFVEK